MSGGVPSFVAAALEYAAALLRYEPPPGEGGMVQLWHDVGMLPDALDEISKGFGRMADRCQSEWPLHPAIADMVSELAKVQARMADVSAQIKPAIANLHEKELDRHRAPRPGEKMWNV